MQRKYDRLLPLEERILEVLGDQELWGLDIAKRLNLDRSHGLSTLYRALKRMAGPKMNRLETRLEPARDALKSGRPRRRLYRRPPPPSGGDAGREGGGE